MIVNLLFLIKVEVTDNLISEKKAGTLETKLNI